MEDLISLQLRNWSHRDKLKYLNLLWEGVQHKNTKRFMNDVRAFVW